MHDTIPIRMMPATHKVMARRSLPALRNAGITQAFLVADKHALTTEQVVVERDDSVDQRDEHQHIESRSARFGGGCEDEELAEEASANGGIPAKENMASIIVNANLGLVEYRLL